MKRSLLFIIAFVCSVVAFSQNNIGIGLNNPHPSAILDIYTTKQGVLIPRMKSSQRTAIPAPLANGLLVFDIDTGCVMAYDSVVATWKNLCATGTATGVIGSTGATGATAADDIHQRAAAAVVGVQAASEDDTVGRHLAGPALGARWCPRGTPSHASAT